MSNKVNLNFINNFNSCNSNCNLFSKNINYFNYIFLIVVNSFIFIANRALVANSDFNKYHKKTIAAIFEQFIRCAIYSTFVFLLSNLSNNYNIIIAITSFISCMIYTVISQYLVFNILDIGGMDIGALIISALFVLLVIAVIISNFYKAIRCQQVINYTILLFLILLLSVPYYLLPKHNKEYVHLHHWYYCMILALLFRYDGLVNNIMIGILLGLMVQGLSSYGDDFIIEKKINLNNENKIDNDFDWNKDTYFKIIEK